MRSRGNSVLCCAVLCMFVVGFLATNKTARAQGVKTVQSSYKVLGSHSTATWKLYQNREYGFQIHKSP